MGQGLDIPLKISVQVDTKVGLVEENFFEGLRFFFFPVSFFFPWIHEIIRKFTESPWTCEFAESNGIFVQKKVKLGQKFICRILIFKSLHKQIKKNFNSHLKNSFFMFYFFIGDSKVVGSRIKVWRMGDSLHFGFYVFPSCLK